MALLIFESSPLLFRNFGPGWFYCAFEEWEFAGPTFTTILMGIVVLLFLVALSYWGTNSVLKYLHLEKEWIHLKLGRGSLLIRPVPVAYATTVKRVTPIVVEVLSCWEVAALLHQLTVQCRNL